MSPKVAPVLKNQKPNERMSFLTASVKLNITSIAITSTTVTVNFTLIPSGSSLAVRGNVYPMGQLNPSTVSNFVLSSAGSISFGTLLSDTSYLIELNVIDPTILPPADPRVGFSSLTVATDP